MESGARVAVVTGAASGIGLALTKDLLEKGFRVAMADISVLGVRIAAELQEVFKGRVFFQTCDVSDWDQQAALFKVTWCHWGRVDVLAANAGIADSEDMYGPTGEPSNPEEPRKPDMKTIEVDLHAVFYGIRLALHYFRMNARPGGKIVVTSSDAGLYPLLGAPMYSACKHGLVGVVRGMAPVLAQENITVNAVLPAFVPTGLAPSELLAAWPPEHKTPMETVLKAFRMFLEGDLTGKTGECSQNEVFLREQPAYPNESQRWGHEESLEAWVNAFPVLNTLVKRV